MSEAGAHSGGVVGGDARRRRLAPATGLAAHPVAKLPCQVPAANFKNFSLLPCQLWYLDFFFMLFMLILSVYHCFSQLIRHPRGGQRDITTAGDDLALVRSDHGTRAIRA